jgi:ATP-binding cassette subfamily B protein/subfamily B ATP-binding cassette protein MsbA
VSLLGSLASLAIPWFAARFLGGIVDAGSAKLELIVPLLIISLIILSVLSMISSLISSAVSARILADFRQAIYEHIQRLPLSFHDQSRQGELLTLMSSDVATLSSFVSQSLASALSAVFTAAGALIILFWIDPSLALLMPLLVPGFYVTLKLVGRRLRLLSAEVRAAEAQVMSTAEQDLEMLPAIKAFAREDLQSRAYANEVDAARDLQVAEAKIYAILGPATQLVTALAVIGMILIVSQKLASDAMTTTELFSFLLYAALLTRPIGALADLYGHFNGARGSLERLQIVLNEQPEAGYQLPFGLRSCQGNIAFRDVWFSYPGREETLRGANLDIRAGEIIALTGDNGAGKTTLIGLLLGFYLPQRGLVAIDGRDIRQIQVQELRRNVGYVPQRALLFNGSVRENIGYGMEGADQSAIDKAVKLAQAENFIGKLPQGYDTIIGDHGVRLSGGQRQRIALARALLKDPPILVLDEATSMYDLEGEAAFVEACKTALVGRTVVLITHRPASLALADRTVEVGNGRVKETVISETGSQAAKW